MTMVREEKNIAWSNIVNSNKKNMWISQIMCMGPTWDYGWHDEEGEFAKKGKAVPMVNLYIHYEDIQEEIFDIKFVKWQTVSHTHENKIIFLCEALS